MNDNLINTLIYNVRHYIDESKFTATDSNQNMKKAGQVLKIFTDDRKIRIIQNIAKIIYAIT